MSINRNLWLHSFDKDNIPNWNCPRCTTGILRPVKGTFHYGETGNVHAERKRLQGDFDPYNIEYHFVVLLKCNNPNCEEHIALGGEEYYDVDETDSDNPFGYNGLVPKFFYPPVNIFSVPKECPKLVANEIKSSFKLFFSDPSASANYIRKTVDAILINKSVRRYSLIKGKKKLINLHDRILDFEKSKPEVAKKLLAIKWLGNEGTHADTMTKNDVLDAYEILESVLDDLYVGYRESVDKKVSKIIKRKKPLHPTT